MAGPEGHWNFPLPLPVNHQESLPVMAGPEVLLEGHSNRRRGRSRLAVTGRVSLPVGTMPRRAILDLPEPIKLTRILSLPRFPCKQVFALLLDLLFPLKLRVGDVYRTDPPMFQSACQRH